MSTPIQTTSAPAVCHTVGDLRKQLAGFEASMPLCSDIATAVVVTACIADEFVHVEIGPLFEDEIIGAPATEETAR